MCIRDRGWVIAKAFTTASAFTAGKKLCVKEGSYWSWWTCDKAVSYTQLDVYKRQPHAWTVCVMTTFS